MVGMSALFDTCILIDYLNGIPAARSALDTCREKHISVITWMEVLIGATSETEPGTRLFLNQFRLVEMEFAVREQAVILRRRYRLKLPDAIIWASAQTLGLSLVPPTLRTSASRCRASASLTRFEPSRSAR
jgi:hypothetical protein